MPQMLNIDVTSIPLNSFDKLPIFPKFSRQSCAFIQKQFSFYIQPLDNQYSLKESKNMTLTSDLYLANSNVL